MLAWMLYVVMVTLLLSIGAYVAERAAHLNRGRSRWIWISAIVASLLLPTVVSSVSIELPSIVAPPTAQKMLALRNATTQALSPVMWVSGSATEPHGWRDFDSLLAILWRVASVAMLIGLLFSGAVLFARKRRWRVATVSGAQVYITKGVGPAVVGLLRPSIVVPTWVTTASLPLQSAIIAHEQSHLDARDPQLLTLALALLVFMPWNLPLWWQLRRLRYAIEVDCDARVLQGGIDPTHYGETLISVGERQSAYIGAVAAMSESKTFLEERIRIMTSKPMRWRRGGVAALASVALCLTALAAEVSPPNVGSDAKSGKTRVERVAIKLPSATLERYVGSYKLDDRTFIDVKREGEQMLAKVTGQSWYEILPERETFFFWKLIDAQIAFANDGTGAATLHQYGRDMPLTKVTAGESLAAQAEIDARIASQAPSPGTEAMLTRLLASFEAGKIDYAQMEPPLADATRQQEPQIRAMYEQLGAVQSIKFVGVGNMGWDVYDVKFTNGTLQARILMGSEAKVSGLLFLNTP